jgi:hypothetical protein
MQQPCSQCGAVNAPEATACTSCGALLSAPQVSPPETFSGPDEPARQPPEALVLPLRKRLPAWLVLLSIIGIPLLLAGLVAGGVLLFARPAHPTVSRPPLYADHLTRDQAAWQCEAGATCQFEHDGLHILAPTDHLYFSELGGQQFGEQVIEVKGKLDDGDPQFVGLAIAFRSVGIEGYGFLVFANGTYELVKWDTQGFASTLVPLTPSSAIHTGLNQINAFKVIARAATITLVVNGQQLQQISDSTYSKGNIALGAARFAADAVFSDLTVTSP